MHVSVGVSIAEHSMHILGVWLRHLIHRAYLPNLGGGTFGKPLPIFEVIPCCRAHLDPGRQSNAEGLYL